jgi:hypothetical protein
MVMYVIYIIYDIGIVINLIKLSMWFNIVVHFSYSA